MAIDEDSTEVTAVPPPPPPLSTRVAADASRGEASTLADRPRRVPRLVYSLRILTVLAVVAWLWWAQIILIPLVVSILISYALEPLVSRMGACHIRRAFAVPVLLTLLVLTGGLGVYVLQDEAAAFVGRLPSAAHTIAQAVARTRQGTPGTVAKVQAAARELESAANAAAPKRVEDGVTAVRIEQPTFKWSDWLWQGSWGLVGFTGQMFVVLCLVYYLLVAGDLYKRKLVRIVPTLSEKKQTVHILAEIDRQIERFLLARVLISLIVGVLIWLSFFVLGLEQPAVWGVLAAALFAIPFAGPAVLIAAASVAAFLQFGSLTMVAAVAGVGLVIGAAEGNILTPWLMTRVGAMNAVAVFVSLLFWGWLWGGWGLLLAVPITAGLKAVCERIPDLNGFAELLKA